MVRGLIVLLSCGLLAAIGCSNGAVPLDAPVTATGSVMGSDGRPVGDVMLNLQPLENGYVKNIEVKADGTFSVETQSGKYAYSFSPKAGAKTLPPQASKYSQGSMDRTVLVQPGKPVEIKLD